MKHSLKVNLKLFTILYFALILSFIILGATTSSLTHDESFTMLHYPNISILDLLVNSNSYSNNHILNTLGIKLSIELFGISELSIRLPNIVLFIIYSYFINKLLENSNGFGFFSWFVLFTSIPLLTDLFSIARGYGMSIGFMIASLYYLIKSMKENCSLKSIFIFHMLGYFSILSNFSLVSFYIASLASILLVTWIQEGYSSKLLIRSKKFIHHSIGTALVAIAIFNPILKSIRRNSYNFGGKDGYLDDTIVSMVQTILHNEIDNLIVITIIKYLFVLILLFSFWKLFQKLFKRKMIESENREFYLISLINLFIIIIINIQFYTFSIDLPIGRFSVYLIPLFLLNAYYLLNQGFKHARIINVIIFLLSITSIFSFWRNNSVNEFAEWSYDCQTKNMLSDLSTIIASKENYNSISLGINWLFEPTINLYRQIDNLDWLEPVDRVSLLKNHDFYYILKEDLGLFSEKEIYIIKEYQQSNSILLKINEN